MVQVQQPPQLTVRGALKQSHPMGWPKSGKGAGPSCPTLNSQWAGVVLGEGHDLG